MASSDKLWFELGVRDEASKIISKIISKAEVLDQVFDEISKKKLGDRQFLSSIVEDSFEKATEKVGKLKTVLSGIDDEINRVKLSMTGDMSSALKVMDEQIEALWRKKEELQKNINSASSLPGNKALSAFQLAEIEPYKKELESVEKQLNALYETYDKLSKVGSVDMTAKLGLGNIEKDVNAAEKHMARQLDLEAAFGQQKADEQKVEERLQMDRHRRAMEQKRDDAEVAAAVREVNQALRENREKQRLAMEAARERLNINKSLVDSYDKIVNSTQNTGKFLNQLESQVASYFSLWSAEHLLKNIITIGGEFEVQHIALQNILGDVQQANSMFEQMKELAVESPFNFRQLATYSKQLAAFGIPYEEMYDTTKRLADMSAGLGVDMSRLILAYGQVRSAAVLRGQELRQFTEAGIPMVKALAEEFTKLNGKVTSTADVFQLISKRAVPFEMVKKVLWDMTSEGGRFYDMQYTLADTLTGKWSNLRDAWEIMLSDIAKGESLSGKFLKSIVEGITNLISGINTLTPLLAGIGGFFALRSGLEKLNNMWDFGMGPLEANVKKAQQLHAIELKRRLLNMEITQEQFKQGMQMNRNKQNYYLQLGMEGRLKNLQIARAIQQKKINVEKIEERLLSGEISTREAAQLRLWRMKYAQTKMWNIALMEAGATIKSMLGPIGWISLGIDIILTGILTISGHVSEINAKNKELAEGFANRAKELHESVSSLQNASPTNDEEYKSNIAALKEILKQHSANYDAIMLEANGMKTLQEQYAFLKGQLTETKKVYEDAEAGAPDFADATRKSFEKAKEHARDYFRLLKKGFDVGDNPIYAQAKSIADEVRKELPDIGKDAHSNAVFRQWRDSMLQEIGAGSRESMMIKIRLNELLNITDAEDAAGLVVDEFSDMLAVAAPQIANKIKYGKELEKAEQDKVHELIRDASNNVGKEYPYLANYLQGLLNDSKFYATIQLRFSTDKQDEDAIESLVYGRFPSVVDESVKNTATNWVKNANGNLYEARNKAKQDIDAAYNKKIATHEVTDAIIKNSNSSKKEIEDAKKVNQKVDSEYNELVSAATGLNLDYKGEGKKTNKPPKTSKKDTVLESAKTRLEEVKDFYAEYKKYREQYGEKKGLDLAANIFGIKNEEARNIVSNYKDILGDILSSVPQNTEARKKFAIGLKKLIAEIDLDAAKAELKNSLDELQRYIQDETSKWNLYKGLLEKTGSKEFAMQAFVDGIQWDDMTRNMAEKLREMMSSDKIAAHGGDLFEMDEEQAEKFFGKGTEELKLWQEIVKDIRKNWTDSLNEVASATEKLMTIEEKIAKTERELAELRQKYGANDPRALSKEKDLNKQQADAFEQSQSYLRFYSAVLSMTLDEAEKVGLSIKKNLVDQLAKGGINADKYLKSIKNIDQQLEKARNHSGKGRFFIEGGLEGQAQRKYKADDEYFSSKVLAVQEAEANLQKARKAGDEELIEVAERRLEMARMELEIAEKRALLSEEELKALENFSKDLDTVVGIVHGMQEAVNIWQDMAKAVDGEEMEIDAWFEDTLGALDGLGQGLQNVVQSAMTGNISGLISGVVGMPASVIKTLSQNHDKRRQRDIEKSERKVKALTTAYQNLETAMENALGGIYTTGGYDEMFENLQKRRDELQRQYELESDKKSSDKDKLADYEQQLKEADETLKDYALNMAKSLYDIDLHLWASQLTEAIVSAWEKGDDAAEAYRSKVKEIMKDLTQNILAKKVMEKAFKDLGIDKIIANMIDASSGQLDESAIPRLAEALGRAGNITVDAITKTLDNMEAQGYIEKDSSTSKSSVSSSIKGVTEETADLLASYINAIRADVSVNRMTLTEILYAVQGQSEMPIIARAQLMQLEQVAQNTQRNADAAEMIYDILNQNVLGALQFRVK